MKLETKIDKNKDYNLQFAPNDQQGFDEKQSKYFPELLIRGDIVYWLVYRFGYPPEYVLDVIAECQPNYCFAAYYLFEQDHDRIG